MMGRLVATWRALDARRRMIFAGAGAAALAATVMLASMTARPDMSLLYSGLDAAAAGEVVGALEQMQIPVEIRGNAIYVPAEARDRARLQLAHEGIPQQGQAGYELLDEISGFSATTDMFNAAYWRAKEGELARTILASPGVRAARVHIAAPSRRPFARGNASPTASVTVSMAGGALGASQAMAFRYLVALSVSGLEPDQVAIIDSRAGMILAPGKDDPALLAAAEGVDREARLKRQIEEMLEARVGRDKVRVSVSVETEREGETVSEKIIQPDSRVTIHSDTEEVSDSSSGSNPTVTVASNLPGGDAAKGSERQSARTESRERVNYDYSEVRRERVRQPGAIRRISVAVLVDGITVEDGNGGTAWQPRPEEELAALRDLVVASIGYDEARGDIVTVESMAFQPAGLAGEMIEQDPLADFLEKHGLELVQLMILAAVIVTLAIVVVRPVLAGGPANRARAAAQSAAALPSPDEKDGPRSVDGSERESAEDETARKLGIPDRESLLRLVAERPAQSAALLREWLDAGEEAA